jgi:hypothetical protein
MKKQVYTLSEKARRLIPPMQLQVTLKSDELMRAVSDELNLLAESVHKLYETDGDDDAKISLHYFMGNIDFYALEFDGDDLFFGYFFFKRQFDKSEIGYQSRTGLFENFPHLNLDYYFEKKTIDEIIAE